MNKHLIKITIGFLISLATSLLSIRTISFGFMGGQKYVGFPIPVSLGYELNSIGFIIAIFSNTMVYSALIFFIFFVRDRISKR